MVFTLNPSFTVWKRKTDLYLSFTVRKRSTDFYQEIDKGIGPISRIDNGVNIDHILSIPTSTCNAHKLGYNESKRQQHCL